MSSLIDHIRSVGSQKDRGREPNPTGEFIAPDGTKHTFTYTPDIKRRGGDHRKDENNVAYFIPWSLLPEFDYYDENTADNAEFWKWMGEFLDEHHIYRVDRSGRTAIKASDYGFDAYDWKKKPKYYSDWWGGSKYYDWGGASTGSDLAKKFAVALQAVQSTVKVIDTHIRRMQVKLADTDMMERAKQGFLPTSMTDFTNREIYVSASALQDAKLESGDAIDVTTGFALHEASHSEHTEERVKVLRQPTTMSPLGVSAHIFNVVEDARIEGKTTENFPGFGGYFDRTLEYMWDNFMKPNLGKFSKWTDLEAKLNAITAITRWPDQFRPTADADPEMKVEFEWWRQWADRYLDNSVSPRQTLIDAMERLAQDPETKKQLDKLSQAEAQAKLDAHDIEEALRQARQIMSDNGIKPSSACSSLSNPMGHMEGIERKGGLARDIAQTSHRYAQEELEQMTKEMMQFPNAKSVPRAITILHPMESDRSRRAYKKPTTGIVSRMRSSFLMRPSAMEWTERLLKTGSVDEDEIWRAGTGSDYRFFEQKRVESSPDAHIALLVDQSGSMSGDKIQQAMLAATVIHACVKDMYGTRVSVFCHTADTADAGPGGMVIYRVWETGEPLSRMGIPFAMQMGNNWDGYAIGWVAQEMLKVARPDEQRILIVLSDGYPNGGGNYGGEPAMDHMRDVGKWAERQGIDVIQIAIDPSMRPEQQSRMFKHWVPFTTIEQLPSQVLSLLKKLL